MADDIDELLDEVESKYINSENETQIIPREVVHKCGESGGSEELDAAIDSICSITEPMETTTITSSIRLDKTAKRKCTVVYVGGNASSEGLSSGVSQRACNNLRCTMCDFTVCVFPNFMWNKSTDYLFLRENMPVFDKLQARLQSKKGWYAYSCQCHFLSINNLAKIKTVSKAKWVCGGHG